MLAGIIQAKTTTVSSGAHQHREFCQLRELPQRDPLPSINETLQTPTAGPYSESTNLPDIRGTSSQIFPFQISRFGSRTTGEFAEKIKKSSFSVHLLCWEGPPCSRLRRGEIEHTLNQQQPSRCFTLNVLKQEAELEPSSKHSTLCPRCSATLSIGDIISSSFN